MKTSEYMELRMNLIDAAWERGDLTDKERDDAIDALIKEQENVST